MPQPAVSHPICREPHQTAHHCGIHRGEPRSFVTSAVRTPPRLHADTGQQQGFPAVSFTPRSKTVDIAPRPSADRRTPPSSFVSVPVPSRRGRPGYLRARLAASPGRDSGHSSQPAQRPDTWVKARGSQLAEAGGQHKNGPAPSSAGRGTRSRLQPTDLRRMSYSRAAGQDAPHTWLQAHSNTLHPPASGAALLQVDCQGNAMRDATADLIPTPRGFNSAKVRHPRSSKSVTRALEARPYLASTYWIRGLSRT